MCTLSGFSGHSGFVHIFLLIWEHFDTYSNILCVFFSSPFLGLLLLIC